MRSFLGFRVAPAKGDFGGVLSFFYIAIPSAFLLTFFGAPTAGGLMSGARMTALLWTIACFCIGITAGFLFGIPRILQNLDGSRTSGGVSGAGANLSGTYGQQVNTNLTEISDWLTKIIVGLGLIHLKEIPPFIRAKASVLAASLSAEKGSGDYLAFAVALTVTFVILGFLFGYICTRMHLAAAFARADREAIDSSTRTTAESASATVEILKEDLSLLKKTLTQSGTVTEDVHSEATQSGSELPEMTGTQRAQELEREFRELARQYNEFRSLSKQERTIVRTELSERMAIILNSDPSLRQRVADEAAKTSDNGLIAGLAVAIATNPQPEDVDRLLNVVGLAKYLHCQSRVCLAIARVFSDRLASADHVKPLVQALAHYRRHADRSLERRIRDTLSLIVQTTGVDASGIRDLDIES